ncbi:hypothetical protein BKA93DRAFT_153301 [Sparassis latifolia]
MVQMARSVPGRNFVLETLFHRGQESAIFPFLRHLSWMHCPPSDTGIMTLITPTLRSISLHVHDPNSIGGNLPTDLEQVAASLLLPISANTPSLRQLAFMVCEIPRG